jgi:hypothetical protein
MLYDFLNIPRRSPCCRCSGVQASLSFRIIPVSKFVLRVFALGHIKRTVEALDRAYRTRSVLGESSSGNTNWTKLHDQAESINAILRHPKFSSWVAAICVVTVILLIGQSQSVKSSLLFKRLVATAMFSPDKFVEVATEPDASFAFLRFVAIVLLFLIVVTPIIIYHFRFSRALFNFPEITLGEVVGTFTIKQVWKQISVEPDSLYVSARHVFAALNETAPREIPFDLMAIVVAYGYLAAGPGLMVGVLAHEIYQANPLFGKLLYIAAVINMIIGIPNVIINIVAARQRAKLA